MERLLPSIRVTGREFFMFQKDDAPVYQACETVQFLFANTRDYILLLMWSSNSLPSSHLQHIGMLQ